MAQWYLSYGGDQLGPFELDEALRIIDLRGMSGFAWRAGFSDWQPVSKIPEFQQLTPESETVPASSSPSSPEPLANSRTINADFQPEGGLKIQESGTKNDVIDYHIHGQEMQFVEIELDPGESTIAEAGAMMYKDPRVEMQTIFGDGSSKSEEGLVGKLFGAGKRLLTGESLFMTVFTHKGQGKARVAYGAPYPGNILPISLAEVGGSFICQKDSFLCAAKGVSIGIHLQKKILTGLFGGEGFVMQKLEGDGLCFLHAGGTVVERILGPGETLHVDTGCVVGYEPRIEFDIQMAGGVKTSLFGGEGLFFARLRGPGKIWLQSLPFSRLAGRMLQAAPQQGGSKGEGSLLGSLANLLDGDNR